MDNDLDKDFDTGTEDEGGAIAGAEEELDEDVPLELGDEEDEDAA